MIGRKFVLVVAGIAAVGLVAWWLLGREKPVGPAPTPGNASSPTRHHAPPTIAGKHRDPNPQRASAAGADPEAQADSGATAKRTTEASFPAAGPAGVDGTSCDDADPCTFDDHLQGGTCAGKPLHCDDDNPLTVDSCTGDGCLHAFVPGAFDTQ